MLSSLVPALITFILVSILSPFLIATLRRFKLTQPIRAELPAEHHNKKGTPLMLGSIFLIGILVAFVNYSSPLMLFLVGTFILFSVVGFLDDFWKASKQDPGGISAKTKLVFQFSFTIFLLIVLINFFEIDTTFRITDSISIFLPLWVYLALITLFIVGSANAINFTDGMDGLLGMVSIPTFFFFFLISDHIEVKIFSLIMIASLAGFLIYNLYPAKAFMGDTGSMAIGGSLSFLAIIEKVEILIPMLFFIYLAEQFSVIFQVFYFKRTRKRLFLMAPIHFHYGIKYGWSENIIVMNFTIVSWTGCFLSYLYFYFFM
ncbi:phospho-N-acetylmuramoyl-pentapeptide-transferase [Bacillus sp. AFS001701]|uniref:phospho-N-acetylmuramoyl-pentapeptide- transferase n=1 Tax=Bacillus sp. AFS001701 TaxID=2033480 RepID=UPI000BF26BBC|nr:phospho-N-acetylmuramoyl-pentapeptide-transferase [Bacillus sp. AFS001701]PET71692.1 phospho-N-acetylmuramoyl-pentapeptide-transferase [Bacillus sp. AFS001701]